MELQSKLDPKSVVIARPPDAHCAILCQTKDGEQVELKLSETATTQLIDDLLDFQPDVPDTERSPDMPLTPEQPTEPYSE